MAVYDKNPRYPMIIYDPKILGPNWVKSNILGKGKESVLDDAVVGHVLRFNYIGDKYGPTHDKRPQLLVLGSTSSKMLGDRRVTNSLGDYDRIHGVNLRYLTQGIASQMLDYVRRNDEYHMLDPQSLVKGLSEYYNLKPPVYRQYLNENIKSITAHWVYTPNAPYEKGSIEEDLFEEFGVEIEDMTEGQRLTPKPSSILQNIKQKFKGSRPVTWAAILVKEFLGIG